MQREKEIPEGNGRKKGNGHGQSRATATATVRAIAKTTARAQLKPELEERQRPGRSIRAGSGVAQGDGECWISD